MECREAGMVGHRGQGESTGTEIPEGVWAVPGPSGTSLKLSVAEDDHYILTRLTLVARILRIC